MHKESGGSQERQSMLSDRHISKEIALKSS